MVATIQGVRTTDLPDLSPVTDNTQVMVDHAGTGRVPATAFRTYIAGMFATVAALAAETAARLAMISTVMQAVCSATTLAAARTALGASSLGSNLFTTQSSTAARNALGATTVGGQLFTASDAAAARGILGVGGLNNNRIPTGAGHTVLNSENGATLALDSNAFFTITFGAVGGYDADFMCLVINEDAGRGKTVALTGGGSFILWPGQSCIVFADNGVWKVNPSFQRWAKAGAVFYVDPSNGNDSNDGLATGAGNAFLTIAGAYHMIRDHVDSQGSPPTITLQAGTHDVGAGVDLNYPLVGASQLFIDGSGTATCTVRCNAGGSCFIARDLSTVTIGKMTLSTFGNGSVMVSATQGSTIDLGHGGNVDFNAAPLGMHAYAGPQGSINFLSGYAINGAASSHLVVTDTGHMNYGSFDVSGAASLAFDQFAAVDSGGVLTAGGVAMTFSGFAAVTGQKFVVSGNGIIKSSSTVYPGDVAGGTATGGLYS